MTMSKPILLLLALVTASSWAFSSPATLTKSPQQLFGVLQGRNQQAAIVRFMSSSEDPSSMEASTEADPMADAMEDIDDATKDMMERQARADELRSQEVFMKKSTGKHQCTNCDWEFDQAIGDSMMIGGNIKPGTTFEELPSNWRCPVCRASKDSFEEVVVEIPGFEVNQGYGFGTNTWSAEQKNGVIFGGLALFFILFIGGYGMS